MLQHQTERIRKESEKKFKGKNFIDAITEPVFVNVYGAHPYRPARLGIDSWAP
jgi:hypothetical protein